MRSGQVIGAVLFTLALGAASDAEARGRGGRIARIGKAGAVAVVSTGSIATASAARTAPESGLRGGDSASAPVAAPAPTLREVRAAEPWCASRRLVGTGTGFCLVN